MERWYNRYGGSVAATLFWLLTFAIAVAALVIALGRGTGHAAVVQNYTVAGNYTSKVPAGAVAVIITLSGSGGGGAGGDNATYGGGGGGSGSYVHDFVFRINSAVYKTIPITVAPGGAGGHVTHNGADGSASSVLIGNWPVYAYGGGGGTSGGDYEGGGGAGTNGNAMGSSGGGQSDQEQFGDTPGPNAGLTGYQGPDSCNNDPCETSAEGIQYLNVVTGSGGGEASYAGAFFEGGLLGTPAGGTVDGTDFCGGGGAGGAGGPGGNAGNATVAPTACGGYGAGGGGGGKKGAGTDGCDGFVQLVYLF